MPNPTQALVVDIFWCREAVLGGALAVVDVLRGIQTLSAMRNPAHGPRVTWRWIKASGAVASTGMPRSPPDYGRNARRRSVAHVLVLPGWHASSGPHLEQLARRDAAIGAYARQVLGSGGQVISLYNASAVLGLCGLLRGRRVAAPWAYMTTILRLSEGMEAVTEAAWSRADGIWSCDSPIMATQLCIAVLQTTPVAPLATSVSHVIVHSTQRQRVAARIVTDALSRVSPVGGVERARQWLEEHLSEPYNLGALADVAATSPRTLLRHFVAEHQCTPMAYLRQLRVARARVLLETTYLTVEQVGIACGYEHVASFRRIFANATQQQPAAYRAAFRLRASRKRWGRESGQRSRGDPAKE